MKFLFLFLIWSFGVFATDLTNLPVNDIVTGTTAVGFLGVAYKVWSIIKKFIPFVLETKTEIDSIKSDIEKLKGKKND